MNLWSASTACPTLKPHDQRRRAATLLGAAAVWTALLSWAVATPAAAHAADAPDATNYRTTITGITPALPGVSVRAIEAGARLELTNHSDRVVEVLGYSNEAYLEIRPDGVFENVNSPATYLNATLQGGVVPPANADPAAAPQWRKTSDQPVARWHDKRARWTALQPPPAVAADPGTGHRIADWSVPLRMADDLSTLELRGTLDWVPPPSAALWWSLTIVVAAALAALGLVAALRVQLLGMILIVGGLAALTYVTAREIDAGARGAWEIVAGVFASELWPAVAGLTALLAGGYALRNRPSGPFAVALAGAGLALFGGLVNAAVFFRSVAPIPWPDLVARLIVLAVLAIGIGVCGAAALLMRRSARPGGN
ncbi:hypothetical protein AB0H43_12710 [Hamadaea sp. NPDC050747]|uniref:hypothetical protein n=1 Tax=Hamadaea sp. NPDC050747 TaxID=3155789 RepID=UPI00340592F1